MPVADGLEVLDADDLADGARVEHAPEQPRVGRVAHHVRHGGDHAGMLDPGDDPLALRLGRRQRLLDQQRAALPGQRQRGLGVVGVERGDHRGVGHRPGGDRVAPVAEAARGGIPCSSPSRSR